MEGFDTGRTDWAGRHTAGYVVFNDYIYLIGGDANQGVHQEDIWRSKDGLHWELVLESVPWGPRVLHMTFVFEGHIYVVGGQTMPKFTPDEVVNEVYYNDIWRSNDGVNWQKVRVEPPLWLPRGGVGGNGFVFKDQVYLVGGFTYDNNVNRTRDVYSDVWVSSNMSDWVMLTGVAEFALVESGFMYHDIGCIRR